MRPTFTSTTVSSIGVYDKDCMGCIKNKRSIMVACISDTPKKVTDLFLTQDQAKELISNLIVMTKRNEKEIVKGKYIIEGNHPIFKYVNLRINRLDELSSTIGKLLAAGYEITIKPRLKQIDKSESMGDILRSAMDKTMEPNDIKGKKINEIIDKNTQICGKLVDDLGMIKMNDTIINLAYKAGTVGNITILCGNDYVFIFDKKKPKAIFYVYDLEHVAINDKRGLITAGGRKTAHEYWLDNGEYHKNHIR